MKTIRMMGVIGLMLALAGCSQKHTETTKGKADAAAQEITGAFGWKLGDRLDEALAPASATNNPAYGFDTETNAPFHNVFVMALADRRIYSILATGNPMDPSETGRMLQSALVEKYGAGEKQMDLGVGETVYLFGSGNREIRLSWNNRTVNVSYEDVELGKIAEKENAKVKTREIKAMAKEL